MGSKSLGRCLIGLHGVCLVPTVVPLWGIGSDLETRSVAEFSCQDFVRMKFSIALLLQYMLGRESKRTQKTGQHGRQDCLYESTVKVRDGMADHDLETLKVQKGRLGARVSACVN